MSTSKKCYDKEWEVQIEHQNKSMVAFLFLRGFKSEKVQSEHQNQSIIAFCF